MKNYNKIDLLGNKIKVLRSNTIQKNLNIKSYQFQRPVSYWIKDDRLLNGKGKEFTIILKTRGCSWALGETGGCSMCGYLQDSCITNIEHSNIIQQFDYAFQQKIEMISNSTEKFVMKLFNSGSFLDDDEISNEIRNHIFKKIAEVPNISEVVIESRVEYIDESKVKRLKESLNGKYLEIAIGLESTDDYIRNNYINKGLEFQDFLNSINLLKKYNVGLRVYLLFKPPFLNEQAAIDDCIKSIKELIDLKVNTISINPVNIHKNSLVEYLWRQNRYRPPWFYSLFKVLREILTICSTKSIRLISDPSGAGTKRGIHNCLNNECNKLMINTLRNFVLTQDAKFILEKENYSKCDCLTKYHLQKEHFLL